MKTLSHIFLNVLSGAVGGILVILLLNNSPQTAKFFQTNKPLIPEVTTANNKQESINPQNKQANSSENTIVAAVEMANPAVVSIVVTKDVPIIERYYEEVPRTPFSPFGDFFGNDFFSPFNYQQPQYRQKGTEKREVGGGSGFIVSADGMIVTNRHVVSEDDVEYTVFTNDGTKYDAKVLARDPVSDLAVLQVEAADLRYLEFANSEELKVGQTVIAIGNALAEFRNTVSVGVISGLSRSIVAGDGRGQSEQLEGVIQTDAAINPGNSGGPLLNSAGQVIGVNVAVAQGSENIGFALPANLARDTVNSVRETGRIVRPFIGVRYMPINAALVEKNKLPVDYGALVIRGSTPDELAVLPSSPADKAGIVEGDIILEIDGQKLADGSTLASIIRQHKVGDSLNLKILSKGEERTVQVVLEESPE